MVTGLCYTLFVVVQHVCITATLLELHLKMNGNEFYWVMVFCPYISEKGGLQKHFLEKKFKYYYVSSVGSKYQWVYIAIGT